MLESFKINCYPLNRAIRITISLPKNYNNSTRFYPVIYFLDGQNVFSAKDSFTNESLDLLNIINDISPEKEAIYIGIWGAMNEEKRKFEYQGNILSDFIEKEIHPYLMNRYRMNKYIYSFGCGIASLTALTLGFSNLFKGAVLLSPVGDFSNIILPNEQKLLYLYAGENELNGECLKTVTNISFKYHPTKIITDDNDIHSEKAWKKYVSDALNHLIL